MSYSQALDELISLLDLVNSQTGWHELRTKTGSHESAEALHKVFQRAIDQAAPYYWSPEISEMMGHVWQSMPDWHLDPTMMPTQAGFFWFAKPLMVPCPGQSTCAIDPLYAILWARDDFLTVVRASGEEYDAEEYPDWHRSASAIGDVLWLWPITSPITRSSGMPTCAAMWANGIGLEEMLRLSQLASKSIDMLSGTPAFTEALYRIFASCLVFMDQKILMQSVQRGERHSRRRAERAGQAERSIRVIELRKARTVSTVIDEKTHIERTCRWIVSGHWRQQWYPSLQVNQPRWIMPYVKGPEHKPLKPPRARVFAVVR